MPRLHRYRESIAGRFDVGRFLLVLPHRYDWAFDVGRSAFGVFFSSSLTAIAIFDLRLGVGRSALGVGRSNRMSGC
jgi:hypothetical protein